MSEARAGEVFVGRVLEWHREEGWGVITSDALPNEVWTHFSIVQAEGFRELATGQTVTFSAERAEQDEYHWRAVRVWPEAGANRQVTEYEDPGYSSSLDIDFDS
ncbi:cold-shock protein [Streptomyces sp. V2]|uniref:cold-shock protein n=1 Tax=Streptomyces sp. V2 TaxID=1424099 RepID=UPI000D66EA6F|nr:cold shock domain-containing protein [Streptomyces sp. V2]PWG12365.1 cold-shock protein [Streptomyces sp. V2]